jgi:hypothetical protein
VLRILKKLDGIVLLIICHTGHTLDLQLCMTPERIPPILIPYADAAHVFLGLHGRNIPLQINSGDLPVVVVQIPDNTQTGKCQYYTKKKNQRFFLHLSFSH